MLAVIALGILLYLSKSGVEIRPETVSEPEPTVATAYTAWFYTPDSDPISVVSESDGTVSLPAGLPIDGYTFIHWADSEGNPVSGDKVTIHADEAFSAVYAIAFRDESAASGHHPYLSIGSDSYFHPEWTVSRAQAAKLLYDSLDTELAGSGYFVDVDPSAEYGRAVATLKDLGVVSGSRFHPDEPISLDDLFGMLSCFFPESTSAWSFDNIPESDARYPSFCLAMDQGWISDPSVIPESDLTRAQAAHIFNLLRGRGTVAETDYAKVGTIMDVSFRHPYFWDIAEAAISHDSVLTESGETWNSSSPLPLHEEGMYFDGTKLRCVDAQGSALVNESYGNFDFGSDGVITTGMPELDRLVQATLVELNLDPSTMDGERMLHTVFNYVTYHNSYLRDNDHLHDIGDTSWVNDEAYQMLTVHKGNCYNYAAEFYVLAKAIGYDAVIYSGMVTDRPHGWVEIEFDGEPYIFDTEIEYKEVTLNDKHSSYYKVPYWKAETWHYYRGED